MYIHVLQLELALPGCRSLKEKRSSIKPFLHRLQREFNLSLSEIGLNDHWNRALIAAVIVSNDVSYNQQVLQQVISFVERHFPDLDLADQRIEER